MEEDEVRKPRNTGEVLWWLVFEPLLLKEYFKALKDSQGRFKVVLVSFVGIIALCFFIYGLILLLLCWLNLPYFFPDVYNATIVESWSTDLIKNLFLLFQISICFFLGGMVLSFVPTLLLLKQNSEAVFKLGFTFCLYFSLQSLWIGLVDSNWLMTGLFWTSPAIPLAVGLIGQSDEGLARGLAVSLYIGLMGGFVLGMVYGIISYDFFSYLMPGLVSGLLLGSVLSLIVSSISLFFIFRIYLYLLYALMCCFNKYNLKYNPYCWDGIIFFTLPLLQSTLQKEAYENPKHAISYSQFLFNQRPLQKKLAWLVRLATLAGQWKQQRGNSNSFKYFPALDRNTVWNEDKAGLINLSSFLIPLPTTEWQPQIETTRLALLDVEQESNIRRKVAYFKTYRVEIDKLYDLALQQPRTWGQYFVKALELWQKSATEKLRELELEAEAEEPIAPNIYRGGEKLKPEDGELFLGREDLRDAFKNRVLTATQMPLFFIQGQRRVGKSSLIAFLPRILDRKFQVVAFDMQEHPGLQLPDLLQKLWQRIHESILRKAAESLKMSEAWLSAWQVFRKELDVLAQEQETRLVIAIDEYEVLHQILQTRPEEAAQLLGAIRAWSQNQNKVVLLFAGADFLSELRSPNWSEYFVQAERLLVDYLNRRDSFKLINLVGLKYPEELLEKMYQETQGHPCLLQKICREIVTIVNKQGRESRAVTAADYQAALKQALLMPDDGVVNLFWNQFCENRGLKPTVRQILNGEQPSDERAILMLEDHQFIVAEEGKWRLRVPLFELWLRRYQVI